MMSMILDLMQKVNESDNQQRERRASPIGSPSTSQDFRRKTTLLASPTRQLDVSDTVRRVEWCLHQLALQDDTYSEENLSGDEDQL